MRIVCESCGKKYSTTSEPVPGKAYRLSCRGCGRPLTIRAPGEGAGPQVEVEVVPQASAAPAGQPAEAPRPPRLVRRPSSGRGAEAPPIAPRVEGAPALELPELPPEAGEAAALDSGYIDLFADERPEASVPTPPVPRPAVPTPVAGAVAPIVLAATPVPEREVPGPPRPSRTQGDSPRAVPAASPASARRRRPTAAVAVGAAAVALVAVIALWRGGDGGVGPAPRDTPTMPAAAGPSQPPVPDPAGAPAPAGEGASAAQGTASHPARPPPPAAGQPRREPAGPAAPRPPQAVASRATASGPAHPATRSPALPASPSAPAPRAAATVAAATPPPAAPPAVEPGPEPLDALSPGMIRDSIRAGQPARAACLGEAPAGTLDGRTVVVKVTVKPSGVVAYPTLDDAAIGGTGLGACLKDAARRMTFPRFKGEALRLEIPVALVH